MIESCEPPFTDNHHSRLVIARRPRRSALGHQDTSSQDISESGYQAQSNTWLFSSLRGAQRRSNPASVRVSAGRTIRPTRLLGRVHAERSEVLAMTSSVH
jgi:hypothetical protein